MAVQDSELLTLSGGANDGVPILVVATATAGTVIHTASTNPLDIDRILIKACSVHTTTVDLSIEFGGVVSPGNVVKYLGLPAGAGETVILSYSPLKGNATPKVVRAFASVANVVIITGEVLRVNQT